MRLIMALLGLAAVAGAILEPWQRAVPIALAYTLLVAYYVTVRVRRRRRARR